MKLKETTEAQLAQFILSHKEVWTDILDQVDEMRVQALQDTLDATTKAGKEGFNAVAHAYAIANIQGTVNGVTDFIQEIIRIVDKVEKKNLNK